MRLKSAGLKRKPANVCCSRRELHTWATLCPRMALRLTMQRLNEFLQRNLQQTAITLTIIIQLQVTGLLTRHWPRLTAEVKRWTKCCHDCGDKKNWGKT